MMEKIWAIILAGGESRRMGSPKMLLPFRGKTMLETVIGNVAGSKVNGILVVLGAEKDRISELLENQPVKTCFNENYKDGMLSSVKCGIRALPAGFEAVLVFQGDQPLIVSGTIDKVIKARTCSDKGIIIAVCGQKRGHPVLIDRKYLEEIEMIDKGEGLRALAARFPDDVLEVETNDEGILRDFDTYEEYLSEINQSL